MSHILITSATHSNYEGMAAMIGQDGHVYLGRGENLHSGEQAGDLAYYDNSDGTLRHISDNVKMYHLLYGEGFGYSQRRMKREHWFTKADYIEFASLRDGVLSKVPLIREITFAGQPFVPPKAYRRMHRAQYAHTR